MTNRRQDGLYLLILGCVILVLFSAALGLTMEWSMADFRSLYFAAKTLDRHSDPYNSESVLALAREDGLDRADKPTVASTMDTHNPYPPAQFSMTFPLGWLSLRYAGAIWMTLSLLSLIAGAILTWRASADYAPVIAGALIAFMLADSESVISLGNAAAIAIGLCVTAIWCFVLDRYALFGIIAFAMSLSLKPQEGGLIWIFLLLSGGIYRTRAIQSFLVALGLVTPAFLWVSLVAPHWPRELGNSIALFNAPGSINDPGPSSILWPTAMVNLQTLVSLANNTPSFYNVVSFALCACMVAPLVVALLRSKAEHRVAQTNVWIGLAATAAMTLLVVYHRRGDTSLLLLSIPACAQLISERSRAAPAALAITSAAVFFTGDNPWVLTFSFLVHLEKSHRPLADALKAPLQVLPAPLSISAVAIFYGMLYLLRMNALRNLGEIQAEYLVRES